MSSWVSERGVASVSVSYGFIQTWTEFCLTCWQSSVFWCWRDGFCHALIWFCSFVNSATHLEVTKPRFIRPIWINNHVWGVRQAWDRCETGVRQVCVTEQQQHKQPFSRRKLQHYKPFLFVNSRVLIGCLCWSDCVFLHMQLRVCVCVCVCVCAQSVYICKEFKWTQRRTNRYIKVKYRHIYMIYICVHPEQVWTTGAVSCSTMRSGTIRDMKVGGVGSYLPLFMRAGSCCDMRREVTCLKCNYIDSVWNVPHHLLYCLFLSF